MLRVGGMPGQQLRKPPPIVEMIYWGRENM
jgi:hypothetical protein